MAEASLSLLGVFCMKINHGTFRKPFFAFLNRLLGVICVLMKVFKAHFVYFEKVA